MKFHKNIKLKISLLILKGIQYYFEYREDFDLSIQQLPHIAIQKKSPYKSYRWSHTRPLQK